ncbi:MAG: TonB-dependent receptor [Bacteroidetes bacterium MedPE-SWsnd-G2]|nr:MAG: TonB-dependent receptor [Bacteroidetes bacterium MedPE-SWsnd-G2]
MISKLLFCISFLCVSLSTFGQDVLVVDQDTNEPIPGVSIYSLSKNKAVLTDINGVASLTVFESDESLYFQNLLYENLVLKKSEVVSQGLKIVLKPNVEGLNEVVVSASKFEQSKRDIPQKIISIDANKVALSNPQTSADLLESTGNIYVQKSQLGGGSPMIRGFSTNRLLITVDGVRMNNAIFRGGNLQNVISIDPFAVQNTEITLGAGSVVYGSDAIGGVMSFYTKTPDPSYKDESYLTGNAVLRYASANSENSGHLDFNIGLKKWAFLTSVSYTNFDDLRMGSHGPSEYLRPEYVITNNGVDEVVENPNPEVQVPTGYDQINLMQKVRYEPKDNLYYDLGIYYSATSDFARYDRLIRYRDGNLRSAEWNYGPQKWFMTNFQLTKKSSRSNLYDKIQTTLAYQNFQESRIDRNFQSVWRSTKEEQVDAFSFNLDIEKRLTSKTEFFYGFEYIFNSVGSTAKEDNIDTGETFASLTRYPDGSDWQSIAAYTSLKFKPSPKFILQSGLRYNHVMSHSDFTENNEFMDLPFNEADINTGALTGTAGVSWMPNKILSWKLNFSTAFRAPNIDDVGKVFDSEPGSVVVPNPNLKSEYAYGGELGLGLNFNDFIVFDLSTYYTFLDNALVRRDYQLNGEPSVIYDGEVSNVQAIQNASKAWIYGFEAGMMINFSKAFKFTSQYNIIGGKEDDEGVEIPVRHIAPAFGNSHLIWDKKKLLIDGFVNYNAELPYSKLAPSEISKDYIYAKDKNGNPYSPSWYTVNLRGQYKINKQFVVNATLENITDQRYKTYSSGIAAAGRNLILSLKYTY